MALLPSACVSLDHRQGHRRFQEEVRVTYALTKRIPSLVAIFHVNLVCS
jgi:hypothetical protein